MEPANIDWDNIDSTFIEDDTYENFDAPKWFDLSDSNEPLVDDEAWFCTHGESLLFQVSRSIFIYGFSM